MVKALELRGLRFGKLTVIEPIKGGRLRWHCICDCGGVATPTSTALSSGKTKSCGCRRVEFGRSRTTHGMRNSSEYQSWASMLQRCENPNSASYPSYGGRGIKVCDAWHNFETFIEEMGLKPAANFTIERVDVNSGYSKDNCVWTDDKSLQAFNQTLKSNNTSRKSGVYWRADRKRWVARIFNRGLVSHLGSFRCIEDAIACRVSAEKERYGMEKQDDMG
jgi:hypothetical protein